MYRTAEEEPGVEEVVPSRGGAELAQDEILLQPFE